MATSSSRKFLSSNQDAVEQILVVEVDAYPARFGPGTCQERHSPQVLHVSYDTYLQDLRVSGP